MLMWLSILVAGSNSGFLKQGSESLGGFLTINIKQPFPGDQNALAARLEVSDDLLQSSPQQPFGSIPLNCVAH